MTNSHNTCYALGSVQAKQKEHAAISSIQLSAQPAIWLTVPCSNKGSNNPFCHRASPQPPSSSSCCTRTPRRQKKHQAPPPSSTLRTRHKAYMAVASKPTAAAAAPAPHTLTAPCCRRDDHQTRSCRCSAPAAPDWIFSLQHERREVLPVQLLQLVQHSSRQPTALTCEARPDAAVITG